MRGILAAVLFGVLALSGCRSFPTTMDAEGRQVLAGVPIPPGFRQAHAEGASDFVSLVYEGAHVDPIELLGGIAASLASKGWSVRQPDEDWGEKRIYASMGSRALRISVVHFPGRTSPWVEPARWEIHVYGVDSPYGIVEPLAASG